MRIVKSFLVLLQAAAVLQAQPHYQTMPGSKLWLDGSSTVNTFSFKTVHVNGAASFENDSPHVSVSIEVHSFDCGNERMKEDMNVALKSKEFPLIRYSLLAVDSASISTTSGEIHLSTIGNITIAGTTEKIVIPITLERLGNDQYRVQGTKALSMHEFKITPPSAFFGLIQAHDQLVVNFDLIVGKNFRNTLDFVSKAGGHQ